MGRQYSFEKAKQELKKKLQAGLWLPGSKMPSSRDLSAEYECSVNTVEKALKELVAEGLLYREDRKGTFVKKNITGIKVGGSGLVAAFMGAIEHPSWASALRGMEDVLQKFGYSLISASDERSITKLESLVKSAISRKVDGVVMTPIIGADTEIAAFVQILNDNDIKVVFIDRYLFEVNIPYVTSDNMRGAYKITQRLIDLGHKRIAFIRDSNLSTVYERLSGYKLALIQNNLEVLDELDIFIPTDSEEYPNGSANFRECLKRELHKKITDLKITAVFTISDVVAKFTVSVLNELNYSVPESISLVSYDVGSYDYFMPFKITGIQQPFYEMGSKSVELLLKLARGNEEQVTFGNVCEAKLQEGNSVANIIKSI